MAKHPTLEALERAHTTLGELIPVLKAGPATTPEAAQIVAEKLSVIQDLILPDIDPLIEHSATITLKDQIVELRKKLESLSTTAMATDYTFGDQVDAALEIAKALESAATTSIEAAPAPAATVEPLVPLAPAATVAPATAVAPIEPPPAVEPEKPAEPIAAAPAVVEPEKSEPAVVAPIVEPAVPVIAPVEPAPIVAAAVAMPAEPAPAAAPVAAAPAAPPAAPTLDLETVKALMKSVIDETLKDVRAELANVQKALRPGAMPAIPGTRDVSVRPPAPAPAPAADPLETMDFAQSPDLSKIDAYGRYKA